MSSLLNNSLPLENVKNPLTERSHSNDIVSRVKTAMDNPDSLFERADELKRFVDKPTAFEGGREWRPEEQNDLTKAKDDYNEIQSKKENIKTSLDEIDSLFDKKYSQSKELSEYARHIESKLKEIDEHLSQYEEKLNVLEQNDNNTDDQNAWKKEALELISQLNSEKTVLSDSLTEIQSLEQKLNDAEETITQELEKFLGGDGPSPERKPGHQSAEAIKEEMAEIKKKVSKFSAVVSGILVQASNLFSTLFESIKNISIKIASQFESTKRILAQSTELLSKFPAPTLRMQM